jgi:predicted RNA-binding Zn-ribbon protein involved in translation (DUF1610 family)
MVDKQVNVECTSCESGFKLSYNEEQVSEDYPEHCPFCGEQIEELSEEYIEDDSEDEDDGEWE